LSALLFPVSERNQFAGTLSGEQQMLAIGRACVVTKVTRLDEPLWVAPAVADFIFERLIEIRRQTELTIRRAATPKP
jgi:branched-chain amino acid transport system ATP-binding protein